MRSALGLVQRANLLLEPPGSPSFVAVPAPRQGNGHDCGLHVLATAQWLVTDFTAGASGGRVPLDAAVTAETVAALRRQIREAILQEDSAMAEP